MTEVPELADHELAELLEALARVPDASAAWSMVLERIAAVYGYDRAMAVWRAPDEQRAVGFGFADDLLPQLIGALGDNEAEAGSLLGDESRPLPPGLLSPALEPALPLPVRIPGARVVGHVILPAEPADSRLPRVQELLGSCAAACGRAIELEALRARAERLDKQRDLLTSIFDSLPDPVLLTSPDNTILLANRRAERLFSFASEDSEGRRRAIQINTLLFSSFLTRAVIGERKEGTPRELNLADPTDGSDLVFEVLSDTLPHALTQEGAVLSILRDITDLKRAVTELEGQFGRSRVAEHHARRERDQLDAILENVSDPILVTDDKSNIILMNPEAERLFVARPAGAGGAGGAASRRVVQANDTRVTTLISDFLLRSQQRQVVKIEVTDPDTGKDFPVEVASSKVVDARGEPTAIVSIVHDLTQAAENERLATELSQLNAELENRIRRATVELEEHNRRLEWQSYELERAYHLKSEFLASMSHELRTPINVILGYTSLARERIYGELTAQQEEALSKIYGTSQHLLELINDILDLSKIEAGKMPVHLEAVSLESLIGELSETVQPMLQRKGLDYGADVEEGLPTVVTDRTKLKQILLNLLSNAIKFTHDGSITVRVRAVPDLDRIRITVADTGIGIKPDHVDMIFDDFRQIDQSRTREYGGTGLGLSITKKLLTLLGGVISVESTWGEGSCFTIELPTSTDAGSLEEQVRRAVVDSNRAVVKQ